MALQRVKLADIVAVGTSATTLIENTNGTDKVLVAGITLHNYSASAVTVQLHIPPASAGAAGAASDATQVFEQSLVPNETLEWAPPLGVNLTADGDSIRAVASAASAVNAYVHGDKIT